MATQTFDSETEFQIFEAVNSAEARIENGATLFNAFNWLREEIVEIHEGRKPYPSEESKS